MHALVALSVPADSVAVHWFEQSSFALKNAQGKVALIDPYFPHERPSERFVYPTPPIIEAELPADVVFLTHDHLDHTHVETLQRVKVSNPAVQMVGPIESIRRVVNEVGLPEAQTTVVAAGDTLTLADFTLHVLYAKPPAGDPQAGIQPPDVTHLGFVVATGARRLYFTGDPINTFAEQPALIEAVAALHPELGFMTTHPTEGEFPFFPGSVKMAGRIGLTYAVPVHRSCFVKRDYDPQVWAGHFGPTDPKPIVMAHNSHLLFAGTL
ncbi:MAG: MBL fold metallo-hydrolase [Caldilineaceae bacterium]|nr:MBL fold metallo-hydrolase [Caldilineaceae bacterium]